MDAIATQAAGSIVGPAIDGGKGIFNSLKRKYDYVKNMEENFHKLEREERYLYDEEEDVKTRLDWNKIKMKKMHRCEAWLNDVEKLRDEIKTLRNDYHKTHKFFCGICPFPGLVKLGKQIVKKTAEVVSLKNQIGDISIIIEKAPARFIRKYAKKIEEVPSLIKHVEQLKECLRKKELNRICIWGPPGVGKTTIMENLHDAMDKVQQFDIIFWVTVDDKSIRDIQEELLKQLKVKAEEQSNDQRANLISEKLENMSYILFLDEVSADINLKEIGIHDEHRHGKVVFACRSKNICEQTDEDIHVERLSDEDAQKLFWETVGANLKGNRDIKGVARLIINECGGMPLIIKLIGKSLANVSNPAIWRDKLNQLRSPSYEPKQELEEFYKFFKLVYDQLPLEEKSCLLYWAIFPADYEPHRDYIVDCWRAEQFFTHIEKLGKLRDRGHTILDEFVQKSLLEKGRKLSHYKMFEHFQRVALRMANLNENNYRILVEDGEKIREDEWEHAYRISLIRSRLSTLPERTRCCRILTLLLQESRLIQFPMSFFRYMCSLQLLDLHDTGIELLPSSISSLINLKALFLNNCTQLKQLPAEVGDLHSLEIFDIRGTGIHALPNEIGNLTNLKCLRVSFKELGGNSNYVTVGPREMISPNMIVKLLSLEELSIDVEPNSRRWNQIVENIAREVAALEHLTALSFCFPEVNCFQEFVNTSISWNGNSTPWQGNSFLSFSILVGYHQSSSQPTEIDISGCSAEKHLRFSDGKGFPDAVLQMLKHACAFELIGHHAATSLSDFHAATSLSDFDADRFGGLEACIIEDCSKMISIIDGSLTRGVAFQDLKKLYISNLPKLADIWKGSIEPGSLGMLTTLTLTRCHSVNTLFSIEMVKRLNQLQFLQVENCIGIEEIINAGSVDEPTALHELKELQLIDLPNLSNIFHNASLAWPSLESISIKTCENLKSLPFTIENTIKLGAIRCTQIWWNQLVWPNDNVRDHFQKFHHII